MKNFYMVFVDGENTPTHKHESKDEAEKEAIRLSEKLGKKAFVLESMIEVITRPNILVDSYESACEYLEIEHNFAAFYPENKHFKAMIAMSKLVIIAEAWDKQDNFVPDFSNRNQYKYSPWFQYNDNAAGFEYANTHNAHNAVTNAYTNIGSRLCFKTESRAKQFGVQFIELWNDFLLFK
jgi:hypothetical protein